MSVQTTQPSLLLRIRNFQDARSWDQFVEIYGPFLLRIVRRLGIPQHDALDVVQETLHFVLSHIGEFQYDPGRSFRAWLATVARNKAWRVKRPPPGGTGHLQNLHQVSDSADGHDKMIEQEWSQWRMEAALGRARLRISDSVWKPFQLAVLDGLPDKQVAEQLGIDIGYVYVCKCRVRKEIRRALEQIDEQSAV